MMRLLRPPPATLNGLTPSSHGVSVKPKLHLTSPCAAVRWRRSVALQGYTILAGEHVTDDADHLQNSLTATWASCVACILTTSIVLARMRLNVLLLCTLASLRQVLIVTLSRASRALIVAPLGLRLTHHCVPSIRLTL